MWNAANVARIGRAGLVCLAGFALVVLSASYAEAENGRVVGDRVTQAAAPRAVGGCVTRKTAYKTEGMSVSTTSTGFVTLPQTRVTFNQGGSGPGCVIVQFSGVAYASNNVMYVRARIGQSVASPAEVQFTGDDDEDGAGGAADAHTFTFVFPSIMPGKRAVIIEWRRFGGSIIHMHERATLVQHR